MEKGGTAPEGPVAQMKLALEVSGRVLNVHIWNFKI